MTDDARRGGDERPQDGAAERAEGTPRKRDGRGAPAGRGTTSHRGDGRRGERGRDGERRGRGAGDRRRGGTGERDRGSGRHGGSRGGSAPRDGAAPQGEDKPKRDPGPELPADVTPQDLDAEIRQELITLPRTLADHIAKHLVVIGGLLDEDPERAYTHGVYARKKASRIGAVREAAGLAAYRVGRWQEALSDLRAARRMSGRDHLLAVIADCERGLGRPERALEMIHGAEEADRPVEERVELRIVAAGARRDLGETDAALVELNMPELQERRARPWVARLFYAYADTLLELGREEEARGYFAKASAVDADGVTDADERLAALEGLQIVDGDGDITWTDAEAPVEERQGAEPDGGHGPPRT